MVNYWKEKVLPKIKKVFDKTGPKKAAAAEATKAFDEAKVPYICCVFFRSFFFYAKV